MSTDVLHEKSIYNVEKSVYGKTDFALPSFGSLVAGKTIVVSSNSVYFAIEQHFLYDIMRHQIEKIQFDADWYLNNYPDVSAAIRLGAVKQAFYHYTRFGYFEHRLPREIQVDQIWYLDTYPDVRDAIVRGNYISAQEHFMLSGFSEGRLPFEGFVL